MRYGHRALALSQLPTPDWENALADMDRHIELLPSHDPEAYRLRAWINDNLGAHKKSRTGPTIGPLTDAATDQRSGRLSHKKTIIPDAKEHFLTHSTRRDTSIVGGLGLSQQGRATIQGPRRQPRSPRIPRTTDYVFRTDAAYLNNPIQRGKQRQRFRHRQ